MSQPKVCPCGSGQPYAACCAPLHRDERQATTAEALMRSRYSAFVLKKADYLLASWHPASRPAELDLSDDETHWQRLQIIACEKGGESDSEGYVEFAAFHEGGQLHERSRFVREEGRWFYLDGEILPPLAPARVGRNDPCPCGSGRKFKKCCGA